MRILCLDPGSRNFGYCVIEIDENGFQYLEIGQILKTIVNLTALPAYRKGPKRKKKIAKEDRPFDPPVQDMLPQFRKVLMAILKDWNPDEIVVERFQARGLKGSTIEAVSIMIGIILLQGYLRKIKVRLITAAQWKNVVNKHVILDTLYSHTQLDGFTPHETDASCMGLYHFANNNKEILSWVNQVVSKMKKYSQLQMKSSHVK